MTQSIIIGLSITILLRSFMLQNKERGRKESMKFLGFTIAEFAALVAILGSIGAWFIWIGKKAYEAIKNNISDPIKKNLDGLSAAITYLSENVAKETRLLHERYSEIVDKLEDHEEKIGDIEESVIKHDERIKTLFRKK